MTMAETISPKHHTFGACTITVTAHEQNGSSVNPDNVDRRLDLKVSGTADPDTNDMTASITIDGETYGLQFYRVRTRETMNWSVTVSSGVYIGSSDSMAILLFTKKCAADGSLATALDPIKFNN